VGRRVNYRFSDLKVQKLVKRRRLDGTIETTGSRDSIGRIGDKNVPF